MLFVSLVILFTSLATISDTILQSENGPLCFVPELKGNIIQYFIIKFEVSLRFCVEGFVPLHQVEEVLFPCVKTISP